MSNFGTSKHWLLVTTIRMFTGSTDHEEFREIKLTHFKCYRNIKITQIVQAKLNWFHFSYKHNLSQISCTTMLLFRWSSQQQQKRSKSITIHKCLFNTRSKLIFYLFTDKNLTIQYTCSIQCMYTVYSIYLIHNSWNTLYIHYIKVIHYTKFGINKTNKLYAFKPKNISIVVLKYLGLILYFMVRNVF